MLYEVITDISELARNVMIVLCDVLTFLESPCTNADGGKRVAASLSKNNPMINRICMLRDLYSTIAHRPERGASRIGSFNA